jgi:hypothetical protein
VRPGVRPSILLLAACHVGGVPTTPLRGEVPDSILIARPRNSTGVPDRELLDVLAGADTALRERGYRVLPLAVGFDLARRHGFDSDSFEPRDLGHLQLTTDVDAVLIVDVRAWTTVGSVLEKAHWDLEWRLFSARDGGELWSHRDAGSWQPAQGEPLDPTRRPDAERDVIPFGRRTPEHFLSAAELALALHRAAFARLPARQ